MVHKEPQAGCGAQQGQQPSGQHGAIFSVAYRGSLCASAAFPHALRVSASVSSCNAERPPEPCLESGGALDSTEDLLLLGVAKKYAILWTLPIPGLQPPAIQDYVTAVEHCITDEFLRPGFGNRRAYCPLLARCVASAAAARRGGERPHAVFVGPITHFKDHDFYCAGYLVLKVTNAINYLGVSFPETVTAVLP